MIAHRRRDWRCALGRALDAAHLVRWRWGAHDCLTVGAALLAAQARGDEDVGSDLVARVVGPAGYTSARQAIDLCRVRETSYPDELGRALIELGFEARARLAAASAGEPVLIRSRCGPVGSSLGIVTLDGMYAAVAGRVGLDYTPIRHVSAVWRWPAGTT